jgi:vacuolar iron transporter family protein
MGVGGFLASQAERDHHRYLRRTIKARVQRSCDGEMEREVHAVLGAVGVDEKVSRQVAHSLMELESATEQNDGSPDEEHGLRWSRSVGMTEFLCKFGEGLGALSFSSPPPLPGLIQRAQRTFQQGAFTCLPSQLV